MQRSLDIPKTLQRQAVCVMGSFAPNASSTIDATSRKGTGWSVAYISTGLYRITFNADTKMQDLISATATLMMNASALSFLQVGAYNSTNRTLDIRAYTEAAGTIALADIAANANNRIQFSCWFRNTPVGPTYG